MRFANGGGHGQCQCTSQAKEEEKRSNSKFLYLSLLAESIHDFAGLLYPVGLCLKITRKTGR